MCRCGGENRGRCCGSQRSPRRARARGGGPEAGECGSVHGAHLGRSRGRCREAVEYGGRGSPSRRSRVPCHCAAEESWKRRLPPRPDCRWATDFSELRRRWSEHAKRQNGLCENCQKVPLFPLKSEDPEECWSHSDYKADECRRASRGCCSRRRCCCYASRSPSSCRASSRSCCRRDESVGSMVPCGCLRQAPRRECCCSPPARVDTRSCSREYAGSLQCSCAPSERHLSVSPCRYSRNEPRPAESNPTSESSKKIQNGNKIKQCLSDYENKEPKKEFCCQVNIKNNCSEVNQQSRKEGCCQTSMKIIRYEDDGMIAKLSGHTGCVALASFALLIFVATSWAMVTAALKTRCCNPPPSFLNLCPDVASYCFYRNTDPCGYKTNRSFHIRGGCRTAAERGSPGDGRRRRAPCQCDRRRSSRENAFEGVEEGRSCSEGRYPKVREEGELLITADSGANEGAPAEPPPRVDDNEERVHYDGKARERKWNRGRSRKSRCDSSSLDVDPFEKRTRPEESSSSRSNQAVSWSRFAEATRGGGAGISRDSQPDEVDNFRRDEGRRYADPATAGKTNRPFGDSNSTNHRNETRNDNSKKSIYFTQYDNLMKLNRYRQDVATQYSRSKLKKTKNTHGSTEPISAIDILCPKYTTGCKDARKKRKADKRSTSSKYYITAASPRKTVSDDNQGALSKPRRSRKKNPSKHHGE